MDRNVCDTLFRHFAVQISHKEKKREIEIQACSRYKIRQKQVEYYVLEAYPYTSYLSTRRYPADIQKVVFL